MKRPTILDLSKAAGVSSSTVNRILNGSGTVKNSTMQQVKRAAETIGFYGIGAIEYRVKESIPTYKMGFLLQQSNRPLYQLFKDHIKRACNRRTDEVIDPTVDFVDVLTPENIALHLSELGKKCDAVAIIAADHPLIGHAISDLLIEGKPVIAYITDQSSSDKAAYVGVDNWKLGRTAGYLMSQMSKRSGRIAVFIGNHRYQCQDVADAGFRSYIREFNSSLTVDESRTTDEEPNNAYKMVKELLHTTDDLVGILIVGGGISGIIRALKEQSENTRKEILLICRDAGPTTIKGLSEGLIHASLSHPLEDMSNILIETMIEAIQNGTKKTTMLKTVPFEVLMPTNI